MKTRYLCICILFMMSCVKDPQDIPPGINSNPVFFSEITIGQQSFNFSAGDEGYRLNTEHYIDDEGVTHYLSSFTSESCGQCPSLEFEFFDHQVVSHAQNGVDFTFQPGVKGYYSMLEDGALDITFSLGQDNPGPHVSFWTTAGDSLPLTSSAIHITALPTEYIDLCFQRFGNNDCSGFASFCFHTLASSPFIGFLKSERSYGDFALVEMELQGTPPFTYVWMTGATAPFILIPAEEGKEYGVGVSVTDANGSRIEIDQTIRIQNGLAEMCGGTPQFVYSIGNASFSQFSTVLVRYTDNAGKIYSSANGPQPYGRFEILSVADYEDSPEGLATKQLELLFNGRLYSIDGSQELDFSSGNTVIAVSYGQ